MPQHPDYQRGEAAATARLRPTIAALRAEVRSLRIRLGDLQKEYDDYREAHP